MIVIEIDSREVERNLDRVQREQFPFAFARALTWTAQDAQKEVRRELPMRFSIRNNFVQQGIRIKSAQKKDLNAEVFTRADGQFSIDFMVRQELGGVKTPSSKHIALPTDNVKRNKREIIPRAKYPRQILLKPNTFLGSVKGVEGIFMRPPKRNKNAGLKLLYAFERQTQVPPRFDFAPTIEKTVLSRLVRNLEISIQEAVKDAK